MTGDIEVINAVKSGDKERYGELVARYERMVYGIAWSQLGDADLCEEASQETFIRGYRYLYALKDPDRFAGWLGRIARNVSVSVLRRHLRELNKRERWRLEPPQSVDTTETEGGVQPLSGTLRDLLAEMPDAHRECLVLFYLEGKNIREAAALLDISESAMKTRLHRARRELRGRLEERLEVSLAQLGPRTNLSAIVLPLLPAMPLGAGLGASTAAAKVFSGLGLLGSMGFLLAGSLFQGLIFAANLGWYARLETQNIAEGRGSELRKRMIYRTFLIMGIVALVTMTASQWASLYFGPIVMLQILTPLAFLGFWRMARTLRVNNSAFAWGQFVSSATFLVLFLLIGFGGAPYWVFFAGLLALNIVLYHTNKSKPSRQDYNLFLRQASGTLGLPDAAQGGRIHCTRAQLKAFARFVGERYLAVDYAFIGNGIVLWLPPVAPVAGTLFGLPNSTSSVHLSADGEATASLGYKDQRLLRKFAGEAAADKAELEERVADVVGLAFRYYLIGDTKRADALLQPEKDADIFVKPVGESRANRVQGRLAIAAALLALSIFSSFGPQGEHAARARQVSQDVAANALLTWSQNPEVNSDLQHVIGAAEQPPSGFFGRLDSSPYSTAVFTFLAGRTTGNPMECLSRDSSLARPLYGVLRNHTLSREQLSSLGFAPENARIAIEHMDSSDFANIEKQGVMSTTNGSGSWCSAPDLEDMAYRLACLEQLGCLGQIDTQLLSSVIIAHQVISDWKLPEGYMPMDIKKANGLFDIGWCNLRNTRAALWILQMLGRLDAIDREACVEGILRFHQGNGQFHADFRSAPGISMNGDADDMYYALESLHILGALDRVPDLERWKFQPKTTTREANGKKEYNVLTGGAVVQWAYQLRLQEIRGH